MNDNESDILIVAGSGGGVGHWNNTESPGGYGGFIGQAGGGKQDQGGSGAHFGDPAAGCESYPGIRLGGGEANGCSGGSSGGGGGGYYGGGGGVDVSGGGGGSSFARNDLISVTFYNGSETFKSPSGTPEKGHHGHGIIIIQRLLLCFNMKSYFNVNFSSFLLFILFDVK